jgi:hypothetical protein
MQNKSVCVTCGSFVLKRLDEKDKRTVDYDFECENGHHNHGVEGFPLKTGHIHLHAVHYPKFTFFLSILILYCLFLILWDLYIYIDLVQI